MQRASEGSSSIASAHTSPLASRLAPLLRPPWPGCVFVYAPSHSHQSQALEDVRRLVKQTPNAYSTELHPNLIGMRASDVAREIQAAAPSSSSSPSSAFLSSTTSIYPPRPSASADETCQIIVVPSAHLLRSSHSPLLWSQLLDPPQGYATILLSGLPLDRWRTADGIEDATPYRPLIRLSAQDDRGGDAAAEAAQRNALLIASLPGAEELQSQWNISPTLASGLDDNRIKSQFLTWTVAALDTDIGGRWDVDEIRYLLAPIWVAMAAQVQRSAFEEAANDEVESRPEQARLADKIKELKAGTPLFTILTPLIRSAVKQLHTRSMGVQTWIRSHSSSGPASSSQQQPIRTPPAHPPLSPLSSLLLLSAFLASHLAPKTDVRFFLRDETILAASANGSKKTRRGGRRKAAAVNGTSGSATHSNPLLLGPRPFPAQRMLYLFQNLCKEFDVRLSSRSIRAQRELAARQRKRRRRRLDEEEGEDNDEDRQDDEAEEAALHSLAVWRAVQGLVAGKLLVLVSPPAPAPIVTTQSAAGTPESVCLPAIPMRLEYLNQASLRCNCLREEVRRLVLGQRQAQRWAKAEDGGATEANGWLGGQDDEDEEEEDEDEDEDGRLVGKRDDGGEVFGVRDGGGSSWRQRRREWWTRVEEVGL